MAKIGDFTYKSTKIEHGEIQRLPDESLTDVGEALAVKAVVMLEWGNSLF